VLSDAEDTRSTVTLSRFIAYDWLDQARQTERPGPSATSETLSQLEAVQTRMKTLRDTFG